MNKFILLSLLLALSFQSFSTNNEINLKGELQAIQTEYFSPPRVKFMGQMTISYMAPDGSISNPKRPVLMFKTDDIETRKRNTHGRLEIKKSEMKNNRVNNVETFEQKLILIEEKKMELDKALRKSELPKSILAKNDYKENQLRYSLAKKEFESAKFDFSLTKQKAQADEKILQSEITKLENQIKEYNTSIQSMKIFAKSSGIVMHKTNHRGEKYAIGDQTWGGSRVIEVADVTDLIAKLDVPENNIKHIIVGQSVKIKLDTLPDKEFKGKIESISKVVVIKSVNQPKKILEVTVFLDGIDAEVMRPGMRLTATVEKREQK